MAYREMFFVQTFELSTKNKLVQGRTHAATDAEHAKKLALDMSTHRAGVVAFSQMVDERAGDTEEPVLLSCYGTVPPEAMAA